MSVPAAALMGAAVPVELDGLAKQAVESGAAGHIQLLIEALKIAGIAVEQKVHCSRILVSKCNRGGYGIDPWDTQENISDIAATKFHQSLFKGLLTDIRPEHLQEVVDFNVAEVEASSGILAPVEPLKATHVSLWGGHSTQGMRAVYAKMPHWDESICVDGKLSLHRVEEKCPQYAAVVTDGAIYVIVPSWFLHKYPGLDDAIQAAGNVLQNISKAENDVQMLQKLVLRVGSGQTFESINMNFKRTRPKNLEALPHMFNFVRKFPDKQLMNLTIQYIKSVSKGSIQKIKSEVFDALQVDYKGAQQAPCVRFAVLGALYTQPAGTIQVSMLKHLWFTEAELAATLKLHAQMVTLSDLICSHEETRNATYAWLAWSRMCTSAVLNLFNKTSVSVKAALETNKQPLDFKVTVEHIQNMMVAEIAERCAVKLTDDFDEHDIPKLAINSEAKPPAIALTARTEGDLTQVMMQELGFQIGDIVEATKVGGRSKAQIDDKDPKPRFVIQAMADGKIEVVHAESLTAAPSLMMTAFQYKAWKVVRGKGATAVYHTYKEEYAQHSIPGVLQNLVKSAATIAIFEAWNEDTLETDQVKVNENGKEVIACDSFAINKLVLAPNSHTVSLKLKETPLTPVAYSKSGLYLGSSSIGGKSYVLFASPVKMFIKKDESSSKAKDMMMVPFWMVDTTEVESEANIKLSIDLAKHVIDPNSPDVKIPLIKNHKSIKVGDGLVLYVKPAGSFKKQKTTHA